MFTCQASAWLGVEENTLFHLSKKVTNIQITITRYTMRAWLISASGLKTDKSYFFFMPCKKKGEKVLNVRSEGKENVEGLAQWSNSFSFTVNNDLVQFNFSSVLIYKKH